ncbi:MAG: hypothetical protein FWC16_08335 [Defluviitaleaceae bacterium]|nr:hypothetical protein [Defluviitaleaceae bacterium]MCL2274917.1 hypothetical protein [Defluviitaleaceae bacterium]
MLCVFLMVQVVLTLPVAVEFVTQPPSVMYPRLIHGGEMDWGMFDRSWVNDIRVFYDSNGFATEISGVNIPLYISAQVSGGDPVAFTFTNENIFYRDGQTALTLPLTMVSAWAIQEGDLAEIFDHLALHNRYFSSIVAPWILMMFMAFLISQVVIYFATVWLLGFWEKTSGSMTATERCKVCIFAAIPAALIAMVIGFILPLFHVFIFQFLMIYFAYKALKDYWNADNIRMREVI